jgi:Rho GDP-dissociation inhibitor
MSNSAGHDDDLKPDETAGFKVGEKKTIDEYQKLGENGVYHLQPGHP